MSEEKVFQKDVPQKQVGFYLPETMYQEVEKEALKSGLTISAVIKTLLSNWLQRRK